MKCPYCNAKTQVTNSRSTAKGTQTWRRRKCTQCDAIWSSREILELKDTHSIDSIDSSEPFSRDKLFISIKDSLQHRKSALEDATALTDTIINQALMLKTPHIQLESLKSIAHNVLKRFDKTGAAVYKAKYRL